MFERARGKGTAAEEKVQSFLSISHHENIVGQMFAAQGVNGEFGVVLTVFHQQNIGLTWFHNHAPRAIVSFFALASCRPPMVK